MWSSSDLAEELKEVQKKYIGQYFRILKDNIVKKNRIDYSEKLVYCNNSFYSYLGFLENLMVLDYIRSNTDFVSGLQNIYKQVANNYKENTYAYISTYIPKAYYKVHKKVIYKNTMENFYLKCCGEFDLLFNLNNADNARVINFVEAGNVKVINKVGELFYVLIRLYNDNDYLKKVCTYLNIDTGRVLALNTNVRDYVFDALRLDLLNASDIDIDNDFNLVFKKNKNRWNCISQLSTIK